MDWVLQPRQHSIRSSISGLVEPITTRRSASSLSSLADDLTLPACNTNHETRIELRMTTAAIELPAEAAVCWPSKRHRCRLLVAKRQGLDTDLECFSYITVALFTNAAHVEGIMLVGYRAYGYRTDICRIGNFAQSVETLLCEGKVGRGRNQKVDALAALAPRAILRQYATARVLKSRHWKRL